MIKLILGVRTPKANEFTTEIAEYINANVEKLNAFMDFCIQHPTAVGLAANQVSWNGERIMDRFFTFKVGRSWHLAINPKIEEYVGMTDPKLEGCLTFPDKQIIAERYRKIQVSYYNHNGALLKLPLMGLVAQIWQHEMNHLDGIEFRLEDKLFRLPKLKEPARNELCPCGSGKKYKQCCLLLK